MTQRSLEGIAVIARNLGRYNICYPLVQSRYLEYCWHIAFQHPLHSSLGAKLSAPQFAICDSKLRIICCLCIVVMFKHLDSLVRPVWYYCYTFIHSSFKLVKWCTCDIASIWNLRYVMMNLEYSCLCIVMFTYFDSLVRHLYNTQ
jgi:hypothetical protein